MTAADLLRRPDATVTEVSAALCELGDDSLSALSPRLTVTLETDVKYQGFIARAEREVRRTSRFESLELPVDLAYADVPGLRIEARIKLAAHRPGVDRRGPAARGGDSQRCRGAPCLLTPAACDHCTVKILILSDIHGNKVALEAVLADAGPVDEIWITG